MDVDGIVSVEVVGFGFINICFDVVVVGVFV